MILLIIDVQIYEKFVILPKNGSQRTVKCIKEYPQEPAAASSGGSVRLKSILFDSYSLRFITTKLIHFKMYVYDFSTKITIKITIYQLTYKCILNLIENFCVSRRICFKHCFDYRVQRYSKLVTSNCIFRSLICLFSANCLSKLQFPGNFCAFPRFLCDRTVLKTPK